MVEPEAVTTLLRLRALGWGSKRIARELGLSRGTVKRYVEAGGWQPFKRPRRSKLLDGLDDWLRERFRRHRGNADVVRQELAAEKGIVASLRTVQRAVEPYRQELLAEARATVRFETAPGRQLQIDFGERLVEIGGRKVKVFLFVATLGYSRRLHVRAFRHERQESWFDGMESAFLAFGGVPEEVLLDNPAPWSRSMMPRPGRSSSTRSSWPSPGTGASGRAPARRTGRGPRARPSGASATSSGTRSPAGALPAGKRSRRIWRPGSGTSPMPGCTARPARRRWSASRATRWRC
jgi:hypothetical protein